MKAKVLAGCLAILVVGVTLAGEKEDKERGAVDALRKIVSAEEGFQSGKARYATLAELGQTGLVDAVLGSGTKDGYLFEASGSLTTSEFLWCGTATPQVPGQGSLWFFVNQSGVVLQLSEPLGPDRSTCTPPASAKALEGELAKEASTAGFCAEMAQLSGNDLSDPHVWDGVMAGQVYVFHATRPERGTVVIAIVSRDAERVAYTLTETPESGQAKPPEKEEVRIGTSFPENQDAIERTAVKKEHVVCAGQAYDCDVEDVRLGGHRGRFWIAKRFPFVLRIVDSDTGSDLLELVDVQEKDLGVAHCSCGARFEAGARFCAICGKARPASEPSPPDAPASCKSCGAALPPHAHFCPQCGKPIS